MKKETKFDEDTIEYQCALTIECILLVDKAHMRIAEKKEEARQVQEDLKAKREKADREKVELADRKKVELADRKKE